MASWPENGTTDWNTNMLAFTGVEHNTDGTHDLATIGWTETAVITKDMTDADAATSVVSSLSFQPRLVIFFASIAGTKGASWGSDDGSVSWNTHQKSDGNMGVSSDSSTFLESASGKRQKASITAFSSTGFTLTWSKLSTPTGTGTIIALCFK